MTNYYGEYAQHLLEHGYEPLPVTPGTKAVRVENWQSLTVDTACVARWVRTKAGFGIGLRTKNTPAIDIDVLDAVAADALEILFCDLLGNAPVRVGRPPKRLLLYRTDAPFRKLSREFADKKGVLHKIEILGEGQQFVAYGVHPDTGKPYDWGMDDPMFCPVASLPVITRESAENALERAAELLSGMGWHDLGLEGGRRGPSSSDDALAFYKPPVDLTDDEIDEYLAELPNGEDVHYDRFIDVGMALWHQYRGSGEGFERWVNWSSRSPKHDPSDMPYKWDSFDDSDKGPSITFRAIMGWVNAERKKQASFIHADLVERIANAEARDALDAVKHDLAVSHLDPESRDDVLAKLLKGYKKMGLEVSRATLKKAIAHESKEKKVVAIDDLELALAERVLADHFADGQNLKRFAGQCWEYTGGVWRMVELEVVKRRVMETLVAMKKSGEEGYRALLRATREAGRDDRLSSLVSSVLEVVVLHVTENSHDDPLNLQGNRSSMVINCRNGELWFNSSGEMKFCRHDPEHCLTSQINADYDPDATCPRFEKALDTVFGRCSQPQEVKRHWLEMMGCILQPRRLQPFWLLVKGPGENGKSFLMNIIAGLMGGRSCYAGAVSDLPGCKGAPSNAHFTASLVGKLLYLDDDLQSGLLLPDSWLKKLSEEKLMTANPKNAKTFDFVCRSTLVMLSNSWPSTKDISHGMRRRAQVIEMLHPIPRDKVDLQLQPYILKNELSGVLNLLIAGLRRFLARQGRLATPEECVASAERWLANANPTVRFTQEVIERAEGAVALTAVAVYEEYKRWVLESGEKVSMLGRTGFYQALIAEGFEIVEYKGRKWVKGIRLKNWYEGAVGTVFDAVDDDCGL